MTTPNSLEARAEDIYFVMVPWLEPHVDRDDRNMMIEGILKVIRAVEAEALERASYVANDNCGYCGNRIGKEILALKSSSEGEGR